jgi:hypothetical protein
MAKFAFLLPHTPDRYTNLSEDDYMDIIKDYVAWTEEMSAKGVYQDGHKLTDDLGRKLVRGASAIEVLHTSAAELAEVLGGLMIIQAADYDEAVEIAKTCPHMVHNNTIEVRQIAEMGED